MKRLNEILSDGCRVLKVYGPEDVDVDMLCFDSRKVGAGCLFTAIGGSAFDGHDFVGDAVKAGASVVVFDDREAAGASLHKAGYGAPWEAQETAGLKAAATVFVEVESSRKALAHMASNYFDRPSGRLKLVAVTGTNGKTTTVTLLYRMFTALGHRCGMLSTIANYVGERRSETANTTSDPLTINSLLAEMVAEGCEYCFMEASSIGLEQDRVAGLDFSVAVFSNLTHDHLDYHKTFAEYLRCKKLLFDGLSRRAYAITNADDKNGSVMLQNCKARKMSYSLRGAGDHNCRIMEESFAGMMLRIDGTECWTPLVGRHNAYNLLAAYCTATALGTAKEDALVALSALTAAPGRLETLRASSGLTAIIDYAHTPDALENVLKTLSGISCGGKIICLFGCGGDRDKTKRPEMAAVAQKYADRIIVTSDNSRSEKTEDIMEDIKAGFDKDGLRKSLFIADREQAIRTAIMTADPSDVLLLAGKGHETYQITGKEKRHFDEREIVSEVFSQMN